jgi:magnesium-transporting ATPase (P-type)
MKIINILIFLQGFNYLMCSIFDIISKKPFRVINSLYSYKFNIIGLVLGMLLIYLSILLYKKNYIGFKITYYTYKTFFYYLIVMFIVNQIFDKMHKFYDGLVPTLIAACYLVYIFKSINYYSKNNKINKNLHV